MSKKTSDPRQNPPTPPHRRQWIEPEPQLAAALANPFWEEPPSPNGWYTTGNHQWAPGRDGGPLVCQFCKLDCSQENDRRPCARERWGAGF
jgi:hypothetical protein